MSAFIAIWAIVLFVVVLNGFAAGMAAILHVWRTRQPRRSRALTAAAITGLIPVVMSAPAVFAQATVGAVSVFGLIVGFAVVYGLTMAVSLPGALIIARMLEGPGGAYRAFE